MIIRLPDIKFSTFQIADVPSGPEPFRLLNRVPIVDNGEPLVDLRETNQELTFSDGCFPYVRYSVAKALEEATRHLPDHLELRVFSALRTIEQQAEMYWGNYNRAKEAHPNWPESVLRKMTNRFFAPPDSKAPPGHCTGAAVDVGIFERKSGQALDMRAPLEGWKGAPTAVEGLDPVSAENRRLLCYVMHSTGLSNCRDEFWHWSYGDSAWAVRMGEKVACYGAIDPPVGATRVIGDKVQLHPYNSAWPYQFEEISAVLRQTLGSLVSGIEHVGSTSIPEMRAKPILDIDIVVESDDAMKQVITALDGFGYEHQGNLGIEGREAFRPKREAEISLEPPHSWPRHNLYAFVQDSSELNRHIAFRDCLRTDRYMAKEYAQLKANLAARHPWDRTRYSDGKTPFIEGILARVSPHLVS
jgi:D-alanyl-D-alanine dipeptidase